MSVDDYISSSKIIIIIMSIIKSEKFSVNIIKIKKKQKIRIYMENI